VGRLPSAGGRPRVESYAKKFIQLCLCWIASHFTWQIPFPVRWFVRLVSRTSPKEINHEFFFKILLTKPRMLQKHRQRTNSPIHRAVLEGTNALTRNEGSKALNHVWNAKRRSTNTLKARSAPRILGISVAGVLAEIWRVSASSFSVSNVYSSFRAFFSGLRLRAFVQCPEY